jgi:predicted dehydrogenase
MSSPADRRDFLKAASAAVAATAISAAPAVAKSKNDKLRVALIGCGGRGRHVAAKFANTKNVKVVGVCDVDEERRGQVAQELGLSSDGIYTDMRRVLDDKSIDAVIVATPDHWHSLASILACDAGKHVYVEKPISHNIREGRLLVDASARNKTIVQHGTQCRSTDMMIEAVKLLREGVIGTVLAAKCWNVQRRNPLAPGQDTDPPSTLNYDDWVGAATMIPYRTNRVHKRWTMWYHFGTGDMGNDGVHDIDYTRWGLGVDTHPTRIVAIGGKYVLDDDGQFPDTQQVTFEYPGDGTFGSRRLLVYEQRLWSTNYPHNCDSGAEFYGSNGEMLLSRRGKLQVFDKTRKPIEVSVKPEPQNDVAHIANFCDAIRGDGKVTCDARTGHLSTSLCHLGNIATRVGRALEFDPTTEHVVGDPEADALVRREYREHWGAPKGA